MIFFYPQTYSKSDADRALAISLDELIYPYKDAWDRGATEIIPASWHGVSFYFFADPEEPLPIGQAAQCFKDRLVGFVDDAHKNLHLTGIDHLGLYNDRTTRFSQSDLSTPLPGCSCTTVSSSSSVIAANGSADVTLHIDAEDGNLAGSASLVTMHGNKRSETWLVVNGKVATSSRS